MTGQHKLLTAFTGCSYTSVPVEQPITGIVTEEPRCDCCQQQAAGICIFWG